jgi:hypothetical protein
MQRSADDGGRLRAVCGFALAGLFYSALAFLAKAAWFPAGDNLYRAYLGSPPLAHATVPFLLERLRFYMLERSHVWLPMAIAVAWGVASRNALLALGCLATLPWLLFNLVAVHDTPGLLSYYYVFPFWLGLAWPLVALAVTEQRGAPPAPRWPYALMLLAALVGWRGGDGPVLYPLDRNFFRQHPFLYTAALGHRAEYQAFVDYFAAHRALFGTAALDLPLQGLLIDQTDRTYRVERWHVTRDALLYFGSGAAPDTLIYFEDGPFWETGIGPMLQSCAYRCFYEVPSTRIRLAAQNALGDRLPDMTRVIHASQSGSAGRC